MKGMSFKWSGSNRYEYLESVNKALTIAKVVRFEVGEGMEKKNEDFAAEVAAQMNA